MNARRSPPKRSVPGRLVAGAVLVLSAMLPVACSASPDADVVRVRGAVPGRSSVALLAGRLCSRCVTLGHDVYVGEDEIAVGNMMAASWCPEQLAVLGKDRAAVLLEGSAVTWSDASGDVLDVGLSDAPVTLPLRVWVLPGAGNAPGGGGVDATTWRATFDIARADQVMRELSGIAVEGDLRKPTADDCEDSTSFAKLMLALYYGQCGEVLAAAKACGAYDSDRLNVYYAWYNANRGMACMEQGLVIVGTGATNETLAHELGHLLQDSSGHLSMLPDNIMCASGCFQIRQRFTVGQAFRMSVHSRSVANTGGWRVGPTLDCRWPGNCPEEALDAD